MPFEIDYGVPASRLGQRVRLISQWGARALPIIGAVGVILFLGCQQRIPVPADSERQLTPQLDGDSCIPALILIGPPEGIEVASGNLGAHFRPLLVGCRDDLETLQPESLLKIREAFVAMVTEDLMRAGVKRSDSSFRRALVEIANSELGRSLITDVYLADFFQWEMR